MTAAPITPDLVTLPRRPAAAALPELVGMGRAALRAALIAAGTPEAQATMRVGADLAVALPPRRPRLRRR